MHRYFNLLSLVLLTIALLLMTCSHGITMPMSTNLIVTEGVFQPHYSYLDPLLLYSGYWFPLLTVLSSLLLVCCMCLNICQLTTFKLTYLSLLTCGCSLLSAVSFHHATSMTLCITIFILLATSLTYVSNKGSFH